MNSWPKPFVPSLINHDFPPLNIKDSSAGLIQFEKSEDFRMYVCGITPYDATHLGHAATYLAFDLIYRYQFLSGKNIKFVENITDIDDPLLERANRDKVDWSALADSQINLFKSDMSALRVIPPEQFIKVTESLTIIEEFIKRLAKNGYLYEIEKDYYFAVEQFLNDLPMPVDEAVKVFSERGGDPHRVGKKHPLDPLVWSAHVGNEPGWESSFGFGRPGWHVECTAIACHYLDENEKNPIVSLQGGGSDLIFPHHFMSAQIIQAAYGRKFSESFVHTAMISLDGEKMSKSKGNLVFVSKLLESGIDPMILRWALLRGHYQQDRAWSNELLEISTKEVELVRSALAQSEVADTDNVINFLIQDISNNLDTPSALDRLTKWANLSQSNPTVNQSGLMARAVDSLLGLAL
ncbi:L-cysteine:1D-myo-inositol 2-amino-2-deoxy-alpha-D-glucopyranoside ligase [Candidatus Nanopelagicus limnes]|uniref:L-cysteine:1D-myo-inositol 2-amino-2-deoxy-alpha-D-glucopyranoside ligase n=1 Tax=Candidatus Nanopelagicus limnae TaxID=1884634 RepID=A0A249JXW3_9ACTN|nr:class I tRNA ligase family protein [Candidatus Nanopelagicus limnes]ASY09368.1 L-cysteine:1D-myo-inositol 2-amino-2-deoxy-alpha-D-glucopyranoside ligase [Candidatus Nanopelagicus limnes]